MNGDCAAHHIVFPMLCDSLSTGNVESNAGSLAMKSDTTKSLQEEQYRESLCSDDSLGISIRTNPLYGIDIHETESPGLITGNEFPIVESVSKHHVLDSLRKSLPVSPLREPLKKKQENIDPTRLSAGIDSKGMTEHKCDGASNYWQERAKYEEIRARLVSWDLAQERRHSEDKLAEERRKSARAMKEVTNAIMDRNAAKAEAARQIIERYALLARLHEVEAASSGNTSSRRREGAANEACSSTDDNKDALTPTTPDAKAAKDVDASSWDVFRSWNVWTRMTILISLAGLAWTIGSRII